MPLSSFSINPFVDRSTKPTESTDELAAVKAAAWAWYQHGSGSDGKPMREFGITRTCTVSKPSRYKLEAMRIAETFIEDKSTPGSIHTDNSLLDKYEIDSISRRLSYLLDPSGDTSFSLRNFAGELDRQHNLSSSSHSNTERKKMKHKIFRSLWRRHLVICGKIEDIIDSSLVPFRPAAKN